MKKLLFILSLVLLSSCVEGIDRFDEPRDLIDREKMVDVLADLVKLEAHIKSKYVAVNQFHKVMVNSGDSLLKVYNITLNQFEESLDYYASRQDEMQGMYSDALEQLNKELGQLESDE